MVKTINAVFESLASGNYPVFYQRSDKTDEDLSLLKEYNIPIVYGNNINEIVNKFDNIILHYPEVKTLEKIDISRIIDEISQVMEKFKAIMPSLDNNY